MYGLCHALGCAVTIFNGTTQFVDVRLAGIHQGKEAGHGILTDQCFCGILCREPKRTGDRHTVLERLAHHADIGVRIGRSGCKDILPKCPESAADKPKAVRASVTISEVVARSSPEATARFMIPSMPFNMSEVFHPGDGHVFHRRRCSDAENFVFAPISRAFARSWSSLSPVAPGICRDLAHFGIESAAVFTAAVPKPVTAAVTGRNFLPTLSTEDPMFWSFSPTSSILASVALVVAPGPVRIADSVRSPRSHAGGHHTAAG